MGEIRKFTRHVRWSAEEETVLSDLYATARWSDLLIAFPSRARQQIASKACEMGLRRVVAPKQTEEERRNAKRAHMAKRRAADPDAVRAYQREYTARDRDRTRANNRSYLSRRFFWARALRLSGISARDLASLWKSQRGSCGLTGQRLDRTAEIDHILPKARGGTDALSNLRWVTRTANRTKRDLTDTEFFALCTDVMRWIGRRIEAVEAIPSTEMLEAAE